MDTYNPHLINLIHLGNYRVQKTSTLYSIEPMGFGTPFVESLTSYVSRLALHHSVSLPYLLIYKIIPEHTNTTDFTKNFTDTKNFMKNSVMINGIGSSAENWTDVLIRLTKRDDIIRLTMLLWKGIFSKYAIQHNKHRWCPYCYEEWLKAGKVIYNPLIWTIQMINICTLHQTRLVSVCPKCGQDSPPLSQRSRPGYCPECNTWLGKHQRNTTEKDVNVYMIEKVTQEFILDSIIGLISLQSTSDVLIRDKNISDAINTYTDLVGYGASSWLSHQLNIAETTINSIHKNKTTPTLVMLLKLCSFFNIPIPDMVSSEKIEIMIKSGIDSKSILIPPKRIYTKRTLSDSDMKHIKSELFSYCNSDNPPSLEEVSKTLGYTKATLKLHAPDETNNLLNYDRYAKRMEYIRNEILKVSMIEPPVSLEYIRKTFRITKKERRIFFQEFNTIIVKHREYRSKRMEDNLREKIDRIREATYALDDEGIFPTTHLVCRRLGWNSVVLRNPVLYKAWEDAVSELQRNLR